jgi:glutathione S-transferase
MKLYGFPGSPNTWKVLALASHIGVPMELELVDLAKGEQRRPYYLALNPTGRTPTLVDRGFTLWESTAILQYVASAKPNDLWPADDRTRADIMRWQSWQLQHWAQGCEPLLMERIVKPYFDLGPPDKAVVEKALATFRTEAAVLDAHLKANGHLVGDRVTLAEYSVAPYLVHAGACGMPLAEFPAVQRWFERVSALPSWQPYLPKA